MLSPKKFKGPWDPAETYSVGDVVVYTDGFVYHLQHPCPAGTPPVESLWWGKLSQAASEVVIMLSDLLMSMLTSIPKNIDDSGIVLKGTDDAEYLITVDDSGETPELAVTLIEEEDGE